MSYERKLTFNLRMQGMSESNIVETLKEVRAHEATTGASAATDFGKAEDYARQFPKRKRRTRGHTVTIIGSILAVSYVVDALLLLPLRNIDIRDLVGPVTLWAALLALLASVVVGFLTDYFKPASNPSFIR